MQRWWLVLLEVPAQAPVRGEPATIQALKTAPPPHFTRGSPEAEALSLTFLPFSVNYLTKQRHGQFPVSFGFCFVFSPQLVFLQTFYLGNSQLTEKLPVWCHKRSEHSSFI